MGENRIILAPRGINDDNAAMYLAVCMIRRQVPDVQFVTNDFLRDHKRKAEFSRPLRLWLDRHVSRYTLKYVKQGDEERYCNEEAHKDAENGAEDVADELVKPGPLEGPNSLQKVRIFPTLQYIAPAQGDEQGSVWYFPLGSEWICPRQSRNVTPSSNANKAKVSKGTAKRPAADTQPDEQDL